VSGGVNPPTHDFRLKFWLSVQIRAPTVFYSFFWGGGDKALLVPIELEAGWAPVQLWTFWSLIASVTIHWPPTSDPQIHLYPLITKGLSSFRGFTD